MRPARREDPALFGFAPKHWRAIARYAHDTRYVLCFRGGKPASVPYIERGFPAKPMELKGKVDPVLGLLVAKTNKDRRKVLEAGYGLLRPPGYAYVAIAPDGEEALGGRRFLTAKDDWPMCTDMVMDLQCQLPVTSDYDLAAVVDTSRWFYELTYMSMARYADATNMWTRSVTYYLNQEFGSQRILHGSQAQFSGGLANKGGDSAIVFHPTGAVDIHENLKVQGGTRSNNADLVLLDILERYFPNQPALRQ